MPELVEMSPRLKKLFTKTKLLCFGRYALEVPQEATLSWGSVRGPAPEEVITNGAEGRSARIARDVARIKREHKTAEIIYEGNGPIDHSAQLRYFADEYDKARNFYIIKTYVGKGDLTFLFLDSKKKGETEAAALSRHTTLVKSMRVSRADEVSTEPGYCTHHAFTPNDSYKEQEMVAAGVHFPSLPDITFSVSSNKDAYADYPKDEFENETRRELSLLERIKQAQELQGGDYPVRDVLREGKHTVQHWKGEESLFKRADGTHDFEWAFVGTPKDVANPSEYGAHLYSKVAHNTVGAATKASLTDDEAIALWDRLLAGLKFRVKVPGAPEGSYYFLPYAKVDAEGKP